MGLERLAGDDAADLLRVEHFADEELLGDALERDAVLFEHGVNDSRVDVWMTLKTGSRMAAATTSGKPVLMRLEYDGGHGVGGTLSQAQERTADRWAFFLWQAAHPDYQPVNR